ncbi:hypothetical protein FRZ67_13970 [Panacibacter ginsenosidivorans]|uniref:Uncharacterized protein n=1 Tax=Panacibacter ginsenosidivorans TaxID=1813871 RepID=A0A5B8VBH4_9BACT|nr:hypothetical protein [Panacibacter ginsenosidivorans]QEC68353.1 hypothetical protein FRZ67_13970 [Panacibacter ginsenosidivorans]
MRNLTIILFFLSGTTFCYAQKSHYDSIKRILQQDSIEYEQELKDADKVKKQTDSILQKELGHMERITPGPDSATLAKNIRAIAEQEIQKQNETASKQYYLFVTAFAVLLIVAIILFKRNQFTKEDTK